MVKISIDTEKDSVASLKKIISLIEFFIDEKMGSSDSDSVGVSLSTRGSDTVSSSNDSGSSGDLFSMFNDSLPSSKPENYVPPKSVSSSENLSAQDLLSESDNSEFEIFKEDSSKKQNSSSAEFFDLMEYTD